MQLKVVPRKPREGEATFKKILKIFQNKLNP